MAAGIEGHFTYTLPYVSKRDINFTACAFQKKNVAKQALMLKLSRFNLRLT